MKHEPNLPDCEWRRIDADQVACGLVHAVTKRMDLSHCAVGLDICRHCGQWFPPTPEHLNPVVASLIFQKALQAQQTGGLPGLSVEEAAKLQTYALEAIPNDFDAIPVSEQIESQQNTDLPDIAALIPRPARRVGPPVRQWSVAVTTAPRLQMTLDRCLVSLHAAGWNEPRVMVDGEFEIPARWQHLPTTRRLPQIGAWPSYYLTLVELLMRHPEADAFMIVQDDVVLFEHPSLRSYLESILWPEPGPGIASLFCSRAYARQVAGWYRLEESLTWGGLALIFAREVVIRLLSDVRIVMHRFAENGSGLANIDGLIGAWAQDTRTPVYVSSPSLAQHIGHISSLWKDSKAFVNRSATFAGAIPLASDREFA
jgi:hypothetical protein